MRPSRALLVTVAGPRRCLDVVVSADAPVYELLRGLLELLGEELPGSSPVDEARWHIVVEDGRTLGFRSTLRASGIQDGMVLTLKNGQEQRR